MKKRTENKKKPKRKSPENRESLASRVAKQALRASLWPYRSVAFGYSTINLGLLRIFPAARGVKIEKARIAGIPGEWHRPKQLEPGRKMLYFHGGGYTGGSCATHRSMVSRIARTCRTEIFVADYRLAPRHPYPAALRDAQAVWMALQKESPGAQWYIAGDSAGGGLTVALLYVLRDQQLPVPAGAILLSPWMDVRMEHQEIAAIQAKDPMLRASELRHYGEQYAGSHDLDDPLISPAEGNPFGLPPILLQIGTADILFPDDRRFAEKVQAANGQIELDVWDNMMHVWQATNFLPESNAALRRMLRWMQALERSKIDLSTPSISGRTATRTDPAA